MKKVFSLILGMLGLTLLLFTCNLNVNAVAANTIVKDGKTFEKVTSQAQVTEGNYIIGAKGKESFCGDFKKDIYNYTLDVNSAVIFSVVAKDNGYTLQNTKTNNFMYYKGTSNKVYEGNVANAGIFTVEVNSDETSVSLGDRKLQYNANKGQERFAMYKTTQTSLELFKEQSNAPELTEYTVTLNTMGGNELAPITGYEGKTLTNLPVPVKPGFKFAGWYKEEGLVNIWNEETDVVTANMTLYAKWEESNLVQVTTVEELVSAKYVVKSGDAFLGSFDEGKHRFNSVNTENLATELTIQKVGDKVRLSMISSEATLYLSFSEKGDIALVDTKTPQTLVTPLMDNVLKLEVANGTHFGYNTQYGYFRGYKLNNSIVPVELYKVKGSEMADEVAFVEEFVQTQTLSSLKMTYDVETTTAIDVDLRFGTVLKASAYDASAKYGVLLVKKEAGINFANGKQTEATALEFVNNYAGVKSLEATNIARVDDDGVESETGNNYQFAWVVTNMEEVGYATELVAVTYVEYDGALYFANQTSYSVKSLCQKYINDNVSEVVNNVAVKAVFENIIKG